MSNTTRTIKTGGDTGRISREDARAATLAASGAPEAAYGVSRRADVWRGTAMIAGTRIPVFMVEDYGTPGATDAWPHLTADQICKALLYAEDYPERVEADRREFREECARRESQK